MVTPHYTMSVQERSDGPVQEWGTYPSKEELLRVLSIHLSVDESSDALLVHAYVIRRSEEEEE